MPKTEKTAKQQNALKWYRINLILDNLKQQPSSSNELCKIIFPNRKNNRSDLRTLQNYLAELEALHFIIYEKNSGKYSSSENKIVFQSKNDYDIALKHSKNLLFTDKKSSLVEDQRLDLYSPSMKVKVLLSEKGSDNSDVYVMQHLHTGYPELMMKVKECFELSAKAERSEKEQKRKDEIEEILVGKIDFIIDSVSNGTPLLGVCDCCPATKITVKD